MYFKVYVCVRLCVDDARGVLRDEQARRGETAAHRRDVVQTEVPRVRDQAVAGSKAAHLAESHRAVPTQGRDGGRV